jgi:hypothetical protein
MAITLPALAGVLAPIWLAAGGLVYGSGWIALGLAARQRYRLSSTI